MDKQIVELEKLRRKNLETYVFILSLVILFSLILFVFGVLLNEFFLYILVIVFCFGVPSLSHYTKNIKQTFKNKILTAYIKEQFPHLTYVYRGGVNLEEILDSGIVDQPDTTYLEDLIYGSFEDVQYAFSDVLLQKRQTIRTGNRVRITYKPYFQGRFYIFDFKREMKSTLKVIENEFLQFIPAKGLKKYNLESIDFNKKFSVYASNDNIVYYLLTPTMQIKFLEIANSIKGHLSFAFHDGKLILGVNDFSDSLEFKITKPINKNLFKSFDNQILFAEEVIKELKINSSKFKDGDTL